MVIELWTLVGSSGAYHHSLKEMRGEDEDACRMAEMHCEEKMAMVENGVGQ